MDRLRKLSIYVTLGLLVIIAFWLLFNADKQIEGVALLISVLSLSVASITLNQFLDSKLPEILVEVTDNRRYNLLTLVIKDIGKMTAYNVEITFPEKPLIRYYNKADNEKFSKLTYQAIASQNELVIGLGGPQYFIDLKNKEELVHEVEISFRTSSDRSWFNRYTTKSKLDVSALSETLLSPNEELTALKNVPDELKMIREKITQISDEISRPRREATAKRLMKERKSQKKKND